MKIDILVPVGEKGGVENVINMTVPILQEKGHFVRVVQLVSSGVHWTGEGIPYYTLLEGLDGHTMLEFIESYADFMSKHGTPDCILATSWPMMCYVARRVMDVIKSFATIISWLHNPVEMYVSSGFGGYDQLEYADAHFAISKSIEKGLLEHLPESNVKLVYNPVDFEKCMCATQINNLSKNRYKLYFVGRIDEQKRLDLIIQALAASGDMWELYAIGDDDNSYGRKMKKLAQTCGVEQRIHWLGWQKEPWSCVEHADAVVLASDFEGYPLTAIEAQANGIMVLATPVSGIEELITPGENGYLFPCGDWKALSNLLYELAAGKRAFLNGDSCRRRVELFEKERAVEDFYEKLLQIHSQIQQSKNMDSFLWKEGRECETEGQKTNPSMTRQEVYHTNIRLQTVTHDIICACHVQNYDRVVRLFTQLTGSLMQVLEAVFADLNFYNREGDVVYPDGVTASLQDIMMAQENQDYVLLGDLLELQLLPFLQSLQEKIRQYEPSGVEEAVWLRNMGVISKRNPALYQELMKHHARYEKEMAAGTWNGIHHLEDTNSGAFTLAGEDEGGVYYYHSNIDPIKEAAELARYQYHRKCSDYLVWGLGLGYHVKELWRIDPGIGLSIVEPDLDVIYHCMMAVDLSECLLEETVNLVYDPQYINTKEMLETTDAKVIIHYPSLRHISDKGIRERFGCKW